jgi:hypothetical protein
MKKWLEYQFRRQIRNFDWPNLVWQVDNVYAELGPAFERIIARYVAGEEKGEYKNVFLREDHIKRTAASTGGEVSENEYRSYLNEYWKLMAGQGHHYIENFHNDQDLIRDVFAQKFNLEPDTVAQRIQVEEPGEYFVVHTDRNRYKKWDQESEMRYERVREQQEHKIFITFLARQELGQMFQFGYQTVQWQAGDTFNWEHQSVPHCTANVGYWTNYILVTTGIPR